MTNSQKYFLILPVEASSASWVSFLAILTFFVWRTQFSLPTEISVQRRWFSNVRYIGLPQLSRSEVKKGEHFELFEPKHVAFKDVFRANRALIAIAIL